MAKYNASNLKLTIGVDPVAPATTVTVFKGVSEETSVSFDFDIAEIPTTSKYNNGFDEAIAGLIKGTISGEAIVNNTGTTTMYSSTEVLTIALSRVTKTLRLGTGDANEDTYQFKGFFTSFRKTGAMEDTAKYTFTLKITERPTIVTP